MTLSKVWGDYGTPTIITLLANQHIFWLRIFHCWGVVAQIFSMKARENLLFNLLKKISRLWVMLFSRYGGYFADLWFYLILQIWALPLCMMEYPNFLHGNCCTLSELGIKMFGTQVGSPHREFTILKVERFAKLMLWQPIHCYTKSLADSNNQIEVFKVRIMCLIRIW